MKVTVNSSKDDLRTARCYYQEYSLLLNYIQERLNAVKNDKKRYIALCELFDDIEKAIQ